MHKAFFKLKRAGITVYSVEIVAVAIKAEDEQNPRDFSWFFKLQSIGGWRVRGSEQVWAY